MANRIIESGGAQDRRVIRVGGLAVLASLSSLFYYVQRGEILMHGDATAHINIARRVFDSLTPGPLQLGTVWLPLPHILMIPFIVSDKLWQSGIGGSIPSLVAYVLGVLGIFRLVGGLLHAHDRTRPAAEVGAWIAAFAYGANPNLTYMQTTALTEPLYLGFFIWAMVYFSEFFRELQAGDAAGNTAARSLRRCAYCIACAELTRYDGWFLGGVIGLLVCIIATRHWHDHALRWRSLKFMVGIAIAPALWLTYNAAVYGNALDFANGPYSAQAIELRVAAPNPAFHNYWLGGLYFLKSAQVNLAVGNWGRFWLLAAVLAALASWLRSAQAWSRIVDCSLVSIAVLRLFALLRMGAAARPHVVAARRFQSAFRTRVVALVRRLRRTAGSTHLREVTSKLGLECGRHGGNTHRRQLRIRPESPTALPG